MNNKRGQFYLIAAIIIIAMILGLVTLANKSRTQSFTDISDAAEEISIEAEAIMNYGIKNNENPTEMKARFDTFARDYSSYSTIENLYFIHGTTIEVTVGAHRKLTPAQIFVNGANQSIINGSYVSRIYSNPGNPTIITIDDTNNSFDIKEGYNFYFILSQGNQETEEYLFSGNVIRDIEK